ncbi:hypothetical protein BH11PLA2_BH11PLA2_42200 [soil metagenome]
MKRRLLHLLNYKPLGTRAIDHFVLEYVKQSVARDCDVTIGFTAAAPDDYAKLLGDAGAKLIQFRTPFTWEAAREVRRAMPGGVDVLQTSFLSAFEKPLLGLKLRGFTKRLVVIDHSSGVGPSPDSPLAMLRKLRGRIVGRIVDGVACVSEFNAKRDIERVFLPASKVTVVHNGIDLSRFPFVGDRSNDPPKVVFVGQLIEAKGFRTVIQTINLLHAVAFEMLVAGEGPLRAELDSQTPLRVNFLGHVTNIPGLFGEADVAVVPSEWAEAFGLVAIEAMACGAVVLASDAGALPEVVGDAGVIFKAGDAADLAIKLEALLVNATQREQLQSAGRLRVERQYQLHDCVRKHLDFALPR